jgi:Fe-S cluster biogenesis protein NfuA
VGDSDIELGIEVQKTLDAHIRPLLAVDAGDILIEEVHDGHVQLELLGSCSRCVLKIGCQAEMVIPVLRERFAEHGARFTVRGVPEHLTNLESGRRARPRGDQGARRTS